MSGGSAGVTAFTSLGRKKQGNEVAGFVSFPRADGSEGDVARHGLGWCDRVTSVFLPSLPIT